MENIFAYTEVNGRALPGYVSLNKKEDGKYYLSVRKPGTEYASEVEIPFGELVRMSTALNGQTGLDLNNG